MLLYNLTKSDWLTTSILWVDLQMMMNNCKRSQNQPSVTQSDGAGCLVWKGN